MKFHFQKQLTPFGKLSCDEQHIVLQCMTAVLHGDFVSDFEMEGRLGIDRDALLAVMADYPELQDTKDDSHATLAINNCLNEICHGVHIDETEWRCWFGVAKDQIEEVYRKWAQLRGWNSTGIR